MGTQTLTAADFHNGVHVGDIRAEELRIAANLGHVTIRGSVVAARLIVGEGTWLKVDGSLEVDGSLKVGGSLEVDGWLKVGGWLKVDGWLKVGGWLEVGGWLKVGGWIKVDGWLKVGGSLKVGGWLKAIAVFTPTLSVLCESLHTTQLPLGREFYAAMPPLRQWAAAILNNTNCFDALRDMATREQAEQIVAWDGWHPLIRAQLKMFFKLVNSVDGRELRVEAAQLAKADTP